MLGNSIFQRQPTFVAQFEDRGCCESLGHRSYSEPRVGGNKVHRFGPDIAIAQRVEENKLPVLDDTVYERRDVLPLLRSDKDRIDLWG